VANENSAFQRGNLKIFTQTAEGGRNWFAHAEILSAVTVQLAAAFALRNRSAKLPAA
jgi:hypothetical protein